MMPMCRHRLTRLQLSHFQKVRRIRSSSSRTANRGKGTARMTRPLLSVALLPITILYLLRSISNRLCLPAVESVKSHHRNSTISPERFIAWCYAARRVCFVQLTQALPIMTSMFIGTLTDKERYCMRGSPHLLSAASNCTDQCATTELYHTYKHKLSRCFAHRNVHVRCSDCHRVL